MHSETPAWKTVDDWRTFVDRSHWIGADTADVVVVAFIDYGCGACRELVSRISRLQRKHPGSLAFVVRDYPIANSSQYVAAVTCAAEQTDFEQALRVVVDAAATHDGAGAEALRDGFQVAGVFDMKAFNACVESTDVDSILKHDRDDAARLGVSAVPTILLNSRAYRGLPWDFERLVERQISRAHEARLTHGRGDAK